MPKIRISERDLVIPSLGIMESRPDGFITTSELIGELEDIFMPAGLDAEIIPERSDTYFSQKVRNMISHRHSAGSFIQNGFAEYDEERRGLRITEAGRALLKKLSGSD